MAEHYPEPDRGPKSPAGRWGLALLLWITGLAMIGVATGHIPSDPGTIHGPPWLLGMAGIAVLAVGFAPLASGAREGSWASQIAGLGTLASLAVIANWVAFGPGHRQFSGGIGFGGVGMSLGHGSELTGRIIFGLGALLLDAFILFALTRRLRGRPSVGDEDR